MNYDIKKYKHIIWDWNGTLLDDLWLGVEVLNIMLQRRRLSKVTTDEYLDIFDFPVIDYYSKVGFNFAKESFEDIAAEYVELYYGKVNECNLRVGISKTLEYIDIRGVKQIVLSATEDKALKKVVRKFGINHHFAEIRGIKNHYAESKVDLGKNLLRDLNIDASEVLLIGDTTHDLKVANEIGAKCILITGGHQSYRKLASSNADIIVSIDSIFL